MDYHHVSQKSSSKYVEGYIPRHRLLGLLDGNPFDGYGESPCLQTVMACKAVDQLMFCARG